MKCQSYKLIFAISILMIFLVSKQSQAAPVKFHTCEGANKIQYPSNSSGYLMDDNCKTVYILPPIIGSIEISAYSPSEFCTQNEVQINQNLILDLNSFDEVQNFEINNYTLDKKNLITKKEHVICTVD